jgi:hypothetical protein
VQRLSSVLPHMVESVRKGEIYDAWIDNSVNMREVYELLGEIKE